MLASRGSDINCRNSAIVLKELFISVLTSKSTTIQAYADAIYIRTHTKNIVGAGPPHDRRIRLLSPPAYADLSL